MNGIFLRVFLHMSMHARPALPPNQTQMVVICGKNARLRESLQARQWPGVTMHIEGFTSLMSDYMGASGHGGPPPFLEVVDRVGLLKREGRSLCLASTHRPPTLRVQTVARAGWVHLALIPKPPWESVTPISGPTPETGCPCPSAAPPPP